jgi:hypothetical protein
VAGDQLVVVLRHQDQRVTIRLGLAEVAMFFADPMAAFANIGQGVRDDGSLVLLVSPSVVTRPTPGRSSRRSGSPAG